MGKMPKISIIIPIFNEEQYIVKCLDSIMESNYDKNKMEVLLVDGGSTDKTLDIIDGYQQKYSIFKLLHNPDRTVPFAMNIGIKDACGEYIVRLDAHAMYPKDYFSKLIDYHQKLQADNVGGVVVTAVKHKNNVSHAIKNVLSDKLGVGSAFRSGVREIKEVDTVPFGCYKKEVFDKIGLYDERLTRNQDIELNKRLKRAGGKIFIVPDIEAIYYARESFKALAKNNFQNGRWNMLTAYYTNSFSSLSLRHYAPLLFVLSIVLPLFCCYLFSLTILFLYVSVITVRSFRIKEETTVWHQITAFVILHFSYGFGEIVGIMQVIKEAIKGR